ncbi:hypothetical protein [Streptomyces sp. NPDC057616]|uniref:hypothetical protein n=1 Tax=Streptomyces sp. NPDC057616 TaxID=3346183 RepID=UPI003680F874
MDGLAERACLGKDTVFRHFGTRAGIFRALLDADERRFQEQVMAGPLPLGPGAEPVERLIAIQLTAALEGPLLLYLSRPETDANEAAEAYDFLGDAWQTLMERLTR